MSDLLKRQMEFTHKVVQLLTKAHELGYEVTLGDAFRDPRVFGPMGTVLGYGRGKSAHKQRLALDLNLFKDGKFLSGTEAHEELGTWWEGQGCSWGGRFSPPDGNHYSLEFGGVK